MSGEIRGSNTREVLTRLLSYEAMQAPLLIVMEDLHWFDSASWSLLVDVQQKVRPLLLALNTRPLSDPFPLQFKQLRIRRVSDWLGSKRCCWMMSKRWCASAWE